MTSFSTVACRSRNCRSPSGGIWTGKYRMETSWTQPCPVHALGDRIAIMPPVILNSMKPIETVSDVGTVLRGL
jgi:hypothetical protein